MRNKGNALDLISDVNPDWMGMIFYEKSARYVNSEYMDDLRPLPVKKVGVFVNESLREIEKHVINFDLTTLQLHGSESPDFIKELKENTGLEIFKVVSVKEDIEWSSLSSYLPYVDYFLFDTFTQAYGGSGKTFDWEILKNYPFEKPFLLSGGVSIENIPDIQKLKSEVPHLAGLDINSKFEIEPALKDVAKIKEFKESISSIV